MAAVKTVGIFAKPNAPAADPPCAGVALAARWARGVNAACAWTMLPQHLPGSSESAFRRSYARWLAKTLTIVLGGDAGTLLLGGTPLSPVARFAILVVNLGGLGFSDRHSGGRPLPRARASADRPFIG